MNKIHFHSIADQNEFMGLPEPEHPLVTVCDVSNIGGGDTAECVDNDLAISTDFYSISLKHIVSGEIFYGRTKYDCSNGSMIFVAPGQEVRTKGVKVESEGKLICFHEDFVRAHPIQDQLRRCGFFSYAVNEALHLSPREEKTISGIFEDIEHEYHNNSDDFSREIILSHLSTMLRYADRFYRRQFRQRQETASSPTLDRFADAVSKHVDSIPTIEAIASQLHMTPRYLSDALKSETGKTAMENLHLLLIDRAKDLLLASNKPVSQVAYDLGFEYPQYFSRLFKKKVGMTPTEYRQRLN